MSLSLKTLDTSKIIYSIIGLIIGIVVLSALFPTLDTSWTTFMANITDSTSFATYVGIFSIIPIVIVIGIVMMFIQNKKNK